MFQLFYFWGAPLLSIISEPLVFLFYYIIHKVAMSKQSQNVNVMKMTERREKMAGKMLDKSNAFAGGGKSAFQDTDVSHGTSRHLRNTSALMHMAEFSNKDDVTPSAGLVSFAKTGDAKQFECFLLNFNNEMLPQIKR